MKGMEKVERNLTEDLSLLLMDFHSTIFKLIKIAKKYSPNSIEVEWLHGKLSLARNIDPLLIINRAKDKFWCYKEKIINRDLSFFLNHKFKKFIKNDENKTFMYTFMNLVKNELKKMSEKELDILWKLVNKMLLCIVEYKKTH